MAYYNEWLRRHIEGLLIPKEEVKTILSQGNEVSDEVGSWTPLKLVYLRYIATCYSRIISKVYVEDRTSGEYVPLNMYYIDLLAASGVNKLRESEDYFLGSPLIITKKTHTEHPFKKLFFCDTNENSVNALRSRISKDLPDDKYEVICGDCNEKIDEIIPQLEKPYHCLIFADQYSMEIHWETMEKLLALHADIILNFQTANVPRGNLGEPFRRFFRDSNRALCVYDSAFGGDIRNSMLYYYMAELINSQKRTDTLVLPTKVRSSGQGAFSYDLLFITRKTTGGSPWINAIEDAKRAIEENSDAAVDLALEVIVHGNEGLLHTGQQAMGNFF